MKSDSKSVVFFKADTYSGIDRIRQLYKRTYGRTPASGYYERKLTSEAHPVSAYVAIGEYGSYLSMNCFYLYEVIVQGRIVIAAVPGDLMTDPAYRNQGLAHECLRLGIADAKKKGAILFFNFSNRKTSAAQMLRFSWDCSRDCVLLEISVTTLPFAKLSKFGFMSTLFSLYKNCVTRLFFQDCEQFQNSEVMHKRSGLNHNSAFFHYRSYTGSFFLRSGRYQFWLKADGDLKVGDIAYMKDADAKEVLLILKRVARLLGCKRIMSISTSNSWVHQLLHAQMKSSAVQKLAIFTTDPDIDINSLEFNWGDTDSF